MKVCPKTGNLYNEFGYGFGIAPTRCSLNDPNDVPLTNIARKIAITHLKAHGQYGCLIDGRPTLFVIATKEEGPCTT